jgi:RNA polymerase sigma-70 factor (ECF subfamily)
MQTEAVDVEVFDTETLDRLDFNDLLKLLNELPGMYRLVFNLYEMEGYSHDEIAEILGISASTSRSNLARAKRILRLRYKQYYARDYERNVR